MIKVEIKEVEYNPNEDIGNYDFAEEYGKDDDDDTNKQNDSTKK